MRPPVREHRTNRPVDEPRDQDFVVRRAAVAPVEFDLHINLNLGKGQATLYAADLTEQYVDFNKGDISDPASLGG